MHPITLPSLTPLLAGYLRQTVPYFSRHKVKATAICVLLCTNSWHIDSPLAQRERKQADVNTSFLPRLSSALRHGSWIFLFCWFSVFFIFLANIFRFVHLQKREKVCLRVRVHTHLIHFFGACVCTWLFLSRVARCEPWGQRGVPFMRVHAHTCTRIHKNMYMPFLKPPSSPLEKSRKEKEWVLGYGLLGLN